MRMNGNTTLRIMLRAYVHASPSVNAGGGSDGVLAKNLFYAIWNVLTLGEATSVSQQALVYNVPKDTLGRHVRRFRESLNAAFNAEEVDALEVFTDSEVDLNVIAGGRAA